MAGYSERSDSLRAFLEQRVAPKLEDWEAARRFPRGLIAEMGAADFFRTDPPRKGGTRSPGLAPGEIALAEELGSSLATGLAISVLSHAGMVVPLLDHLASNDATRQWVEAGRRGSALLGLAATEAESGADMNAIRTVAERRPEGIVLNGSKRYITNGSQADALVVLARLQERIPPWSAALVLVPCATPGVTQTRLETSGLRSGDLGEVVFHDCLVPVDHLLGEPGRGFLYLLGGLQRERLLGALSVNAMGRSVLRRTIGFCSGRTRMGEPLVRKQAIRHELATQEARLTASSHFAYRVAERLNRNEDVERDIWMLKVFCFELVRDVIRRCAHLHGAEAFMESHWMNRALRDAQAFSLAAGTPEIMKELLSAVYEARD